MDYKSKYIKYKCKYKNLLGGQRGPNTLNSDRKIKISVATVNQWVLDFKQNTLNIIKAIKYAIDDESKLILLPELAICGYSCQDHFYEKDLFTRSFKALIEIMNTFKNNDIIIAVGVPILHNDVKYNTTTFLYRGKIILIRPKTILANDGNYRETRWFTAWPLDKSDIYQYNIDENTKTFRVPISLDMISYDGIIIGAEICEELWAPKKLHTELYLSGADILLNGSGSHFESNKLKTRTELLKFATNNSGGVYVYSNLEGCDGDRLYFDGGSMIAMNGEILCIEKRFNMIDVKVTTKEINLSEITRMRIKNNSYETQANKENFKNYIIVDIKKEKELYEIEESKEPISLEETEKIQRYIYEKEKNEEDEKQHNEIIEIMNASSCWLWDYLSRSGASGFMLPLSGGSDSAATAAIVHNMCKLMIKSHDKENRIKNFIKKLFITSDNKTHNNNMYNKTLLNLPSIILNTVYLPTDNSSQKGEETTTTQQLSKLLANEIGANWKEINIQGMFTAAVDGVEDLTHLNYTNMTQEIIHGRQIGINSQYDLVYQNIQARLRMINTYLLAQIIPNLTQSDLSFHYPKHTFLLVLGSSNMDEILVGYYTKYDASAADINPIGSLSKKYVKSILNYYKSVLPSLKLILEARPTAELLPNGTEGKIQTDETDMNISYAQINELGDLRANGLSPQESCDYIILNENKYKTIFEKQPNDIEVPNFDTAVKKIINIFYYRYKVGRNKTTIVPPSVHLTKSPDDNRFDLRPFLLQQDYFKVE